MDKYKSNEKVNIVRTEKETIVVYDETKVFSLNNSAIEILSMFENPMTFDELTDALITKYGQSENINEGIRSCVDKLSDYKLIEKI